MPKHSQTQECYHQRRQDHHKSNHPFRHHQVTNLMWTCQMYYTMSEFKTKISFLKTKVTIPVKWNKRRITDFWWMTRLIVLYGYGYPAFNLMLCYIFSDWFNVMSAIINLIFQLFTQSLKDKRSSHPKWCKVNAFSWRCSFASKLPLSYYPIFILKIRIEGFCWFVYSCLRVVYRKFIFLSVIPFLCSFSIMVSRRVQAKFCCSLLSYLSSITVAFIM